MSDNSQTGGRADNIPLAISVIVFAVMALSLGDALIKFTSGNFALWQIFVLRSIIVIPLLFVYLQLRTPASLKISSAFNWTVLRSLLLVVMWILYYLALPHLQLSVAAATYYTLPIFITLFSALLIGNRISGTGWIAVVLGFVGVLLILRPKVGDFHWFALLPLGAAILYALSMILTRTKCRNEHPLMLSLMLNIAFLLVGGVSALAVEWSGPTSREGFLLAPWATMEMSEWLAMLILAAAILIGSIGAAIAYQNGPPAMVGTFDFAYVGFAVLWGVVFFAEVPDLISIVGMVLIVVAGILSLRQ
ncbi:MAG: DMT family transporter [Stappiaceae bacterium]